MSSRQAAFLFPIFLKNMQLTTTTYAFTADTISPVGAYLNLRDNYRKPVLMESNDYHSRTESHSIIGLNPLISVTVHPDQLVLDTCDVQHHYPIDRNKVISEQLEQVLSQITFSRPEISGNGFFACYGFEYAHLELLTGEINEAQLPLAQLIVYEYLLVFDHFHDTGTLVVNQTEQSTPEPEKLLRLLHAPTRQSLPFTIESDINSPVSEVAFLNRVERAKQHIRRGDVFQLVVSRPFQQSFFGDDFQVYRQLRRLNPSPYLFYADMESYRIMGSSPETQLRIQDGQAGIYPIAGTVRKTGDPETDRRLTEQLIADEKENAEHTMLVDLARNDLSKYCCEVKVTAYKEIQQFSHVIHLVSSVTGKLLSGTTQTVFAGTFPAGTLSGTPKQRALELIRDIEEDTRDYYGGAIGFIGTNGSVRLAIIIRSIFSSNNTLHFRAGAGVVYDSVPENELQEVNNKLGAIRKAIEMAGAPQYAAV